MVLNLLMLCACFEVLFFILLHLHEHNDFNSSHFSSRFLNVSMLFACLSTIVDF
jgi:hypothetical protein